MTIKEIIMHATMHNWLQLLARVNKN